MVLCCVGTNCWFLYLCCRPANASGEQLSFVVHWMMWGLVIAHHTVLLKSNPSDYLDIVVEVVPVLCTFVMAFIFTCFIYVLTIFPPPFNR